MNAASTSSGGQNAPASLSAIGRVLSLATIYGPDHFRTRAAVDEAWRALVQEMAATSELAIGLSGGRLLVNGKQVDTHGQPLFRMIEHRLAALRTDGFTLYQGLDEAEFRRLLSLLISGRAGGFEKALKESRLAHVRGGHFVWKSLASKATAPESPPGKTRLGEYRDAGDAGGGGAPRAGSGRAVSAAMPTERPPALPLSDNDPVVRQIVAFLKGDAAANTPETREAIARYAADADRLASLILKAATIAESPASVAAGETLADVVVGCLRRAYEGIRDSEATRSSTAKPELRKALLLLESSVLRRLHDQMHRDDPAADARIAQAIETLSAEAEIDLVAAELIEHRRSLERAEKRLRQYARSRGERVVRESLVRAGLPELDWRPLTISLGGGGAGPATGLGAPAGLGALALALERFEKLMRSGPEGREEAGRLAEDIRVGVESATHAAAFEIEKLGREVETVRATAAEGRASELPRGELIETLAEIAQDLLQPLTVINCALSMSLEGYAGPLAQELENLLRMAQHGGTRLQKILQSLIEIVGYPTRLTAIGPANRL